ncbi:hypothetical protein Tco_1489496, partial [Tanacetum coccineum]
SQSQSMEEENKPAIVLDEMCVNQQDYSTSLMGKVQEFGSLTNLKIEASKENFKANMGIGSWYFHLQQTLNLFHIDERVTWVDIEGIPLKIPDFVEDDEEERESGVEEVSETIFENEQSQAHKKDDLNIGQNDIRSEDLFNIYDLLNKKQDNIIGGSSSNDNLKYPPGFTPTVATKEIKK